MYVMCNVVMLLLTEIESEESLTEVATESILAKEKSEKACSSTQQN